MISSFIWRESPQLVEPNCSASDAWSQSGKKNCLAVLLKLHLWTEYQKQCSHIFYHFGHSGSRVKLLDTRYVHCIYAIHWMLLNIAIIYCHVSLMIHGSRKKLLPSGIMAYTFASYSTSLTTSATRTPPETTRIEESPRRRDQPSS